MKTRTDVGWDALDDATTFHRAALGRTARQLRAAAGRSDDAVTFTRLHTWAAALRWLLNATDDPPPDPDHYTNRSEHLATVEEWRAHWERQIELPQIASRRDRLVRFDQDLRAAKWAVDQ
ncbi:MAG: hypothetical protein AAFO29_19420, partial [Actinomycetota bacterium]